MYSALINTNTRIYGYLRAFRYEQDASRAKKTSNFLTMNKFSSVKSKSNIYFIIVNYKNSLFPLLLIRLIALSIMGDGILSFNLTSIKCR